VQQARHGARLLDDNARRTYADALLAVVDQLAEVIATVEDGAS